MNSKMNSLRNRWRGAMRRLRTRRETNTGGHSAPSNGNPTFERFLREFEARNTASVASEKHL
jgi:hypothetical protein